MVAFSCIGAQQPWNVNNRFNPIIDEPINVSYPRIMCWISTHPPNHGTKAAAVRDTWGKRCDKILFISNEDGKNCSDVGLVYTKIIKCLLSQYYFLCRILGSKY